MPRVLVALLLAGLVLATTATGADDWPTFRGADRTGISKEKGLLAKWPADGPTLAWKTEGLGKGFSSVAVNGDKVFTTGDLTDGCYLFAIGRAKGEKLWQLKLGDTGGGGGYAGPRGTPSTDGELVFAITHNGDLVAANVKDGKEAWRKSMKKDFGGSSGGWSYAESPLIDGDNLIVTPGGSKATMAALEKKTGKQVWAGVVDKGDTAGYSSAVSANLGGVKQYVQLMANGLVSFAAKDGKMLWRYGTDKERFGKNTANIPTPIIHGEHVFASAGYNQGGGALLKIKKDGDTFSVEEVYWNQQLKNKHGGVILVGDRLFGDFDNSGNPWCADVKTGKVLWTRRDAKGAKGAGGTGSASMTAADGKLYIHYSNGVVVLADANADKYTEISSFQVPNAERDRNWAHPVVVGGKLYIREADALWCHDVAAK